MHIKDSLINELSADTSLFAQSPYLYFSLQDAWLKRAFERGNCIVFGIRGTGKDLIFSHVIHLRNVVNYAVRTDYKCKTIVLENLKTLQCGTNTFRNLLEGVIKPYMDPFLPGADIYVPDASLYLACQNNNELNAALPGLPIFQALGRQIRHNTHLNIQAFDRTYKQFRDQVYSCILCLSTDVYDDFFITKTITYGRKETAELRLLPFGLSREKYPEEYEKFVASYGEVAYRYFKIPRDHVKYDTRALGNAIISKNLIKEV
jgi:hypothetical protein